MSVLSQRAGSNRRSRADRTNVRGQKSEVGIQNVVAGGASRTSKLRRPISGLGLVNVYLLLLCASLSLAACAYYSFTGAAIPDHIQTIAIPLTEDLSANPFTDLGGEMSRRLVERFVGQTRLRLETVEPEADALLSTEIQRYAIAPAAIGGQNTAQLNRLTITVLARYVDQENGQEVFERTFSASVEYDPQDLTNEEAAAREVIDDIAEDIFTAATSNW